MGYQSSDTEEEEEKIDIPISPQLRTKTPEMVHPSSSVFNYKQSLHSLLALGRQKSQDFARNEQKWDYT